MCGIIGILGRDDVAQRLLDGLKRLEYRGYDSAGIATLHDGRLQRRRAVGKLIALSDLLVRDPIRGQVGIGHTRWATHGQPNERNAHPHQAGGVAVVHNGIIENYRSLRAELEAAGAVFTTETDTEVVAHLCDRALAAGMASMALVRVKLTDGKGTEEARYKFDKRLRDIVEADDGSLYVVEDGPGGRLLRLTPKG